MNLAVSIEDRDTVYLQWEKSDNVREYQVFVDGNQVDCVSGSAISYTVQDTYTTYEYQVKGIDENGNLRSQSENITYPAPVLCTLSAKASTSNSLTQSFHEVGELSGLFGEYFPF